MFMALESPTIAWIPSLHLLQRLLSSGTRLTIYFLIIWLLTSWLSPNEFQMKLTSVAPLHTFPLSVNQMMCPLRVSMLPILPNRKKKCPHKKIFESHFLQTADKQTYSMIIPKWFVSLCPEKDLKLGIPALTWGIQITWRMCMSPSISRVIGGPSEPNTLWKGLSGSFGRKVSLDSALHGLSSSLQVSGVHLLVLPERESGTLDYKKWPWHREWQPGLVTKEEEGIFSVTFTLSSTQPYLFPASWPQERHPLSGL